MPRVLGLAVVLLVFLAIPASLHAEDAAAHVARAKAHLDKREYHKASAECDKAIDLDSNSAEAYNLRGRVRIEKHDDQPWFDAGAEAHSDFGKAVADCDEALTIDAKFVDAYLTRASALWRLRKFVDAIADCNKAISLEPKSAKAYSVRARVRLVARDYDKVIGDCNKAISLDQKLADAYNIRGSAWIDKGEYDKALDDCSKALALDPRLAEAHMGRGLVWAHRGNQDKAIEEYKKATEIAPTDWRILNDLGVASWVQAQQQDIKAAAATAAGDEEAAKTCRQKSLTLKKRAKVYWIQGIKVRPAATDIHSNLGYAYSEAASQATDPAEVERNLERAEYRLKYAVACDPSESRPHNNLGRILLRRSQQCEAAAREAETKK